MPHTMERIIVMLTLICSLVQHVSCSTIRTNLRILPTDPDDIVLFSQPGQSLFSSCESKETFFKLASQFVTQENQGFCGPASSVMVLNALNANLTVSPEYSPYAYWTQHSWVATPCLRKVLKNKFMGMTLAQVGQGLACSGVQSNVFYASQSSVKEFRNVARSALSKGFPVIVNFNRRELHEEGYGHFSPIAAYNEEHDRFLLMDVARYKYPPVWARTETLFKAMNTPDILAQTSRGYIAVVSVDH